jgi:hypothetical protein
VRSALQAPAMNAYAPSAVKSFAVASPIPAVPPHRSSPLLVTSCSQADCSGSGWSRLSSSCRVSASSWRTMARLRSACPYAIGPFSVHVWRGGPAGRRSLAGPGFRSRPGLSGEVLAGGLLAQERVYLGAELNRVLEEETVAGVGVDAEPGAGEVIGQQVGVLGGDHDVVVAVGHQGGLGDPGEAVEARGVRGCPRSRWR